MSFHLVKHFEKIFIARIMLIQATPGPNLHEEQGQGIFSSRLCTNGHLRLSQTLFCTTCWQNLKKGSLRRIFFLAFHLFIDNSSTIFYNLPDIIPTNEHQGTRQMLRSQLQFCDSIEFLCFHWLIDKKQILSPQWQTSKASFKLKLGQNKRNKCA